MYQNNYQIQNRRTFQESGAAGYLKKNILKYG